MSTNKLSIGAVLLEITPWFFEKNMLKISLSGHNLYVASIDIAVLTAAPKMSRLDFYLLFITTWNNVLWWEGKSGLVKMKNSPTALIWSASENNWWKWICSLSEWIITFSLHNKPVLQKFIFKRYSCCHHLLKSCCKNTIEDWLSFVERDR